MFDDYIVLAFDKHELYIASFLLTTTQSKKQR